MANASIYAAFERMWQHITSALGNKSDKTDVENLQNLIGTLQTEVDGKAPSIHGTHVTYSTTAPVMDGTASAGSASTVARSDHKHPTDTSRAAQADLTSHTGNATIHITSTERTNWNAAKTHADSVHAPSNAEKNQNAFSNVVVGSTTIAADTTTDSLTLVGSNVTLTPDATNDKVTIGITKANVTSALGYTPPTKDTTYSAAGTSLGLVKSGGDVAISDGVITVNDDSHNHIISNVDGLQTALDGKSDSGHTHNYAGSSSAGGAATSANKLTTARTISLNGAVSGSTTFDGSNNVSITTSNG